MERNGDIGLVLASMVESLPGEVEKARLRATERKRERRRAAERRRRKELEAEERRRLAEADRVAGAKARRKRIRRDALRLVEANPCAGYSWIRSQLGVTSAECQEALDHLLLDGAIEAVLVTGSSGRRYRRTGS